MCKLTTLHLRRIKANLKNCQRNLSLSKRPLRSRKKVSLKNLSRPQTTINKTYFLKINLKQAMNVSERRSSLKMKKILITKKSQ